MFLLVLPHERIRSICNFQLPLVLDVEMLLRVFHQCPDLHQNIKKQSDISSQILILKTASYDFLRAWLHFSDIFRPSSLPLLAEMSFGPLLFFSSTHWRICDRSVIRQIWNQDNMTFCAGGCSRVKPVWPKMKISPSEMSPGKQTEHVSVTYYTGSRSSN